MSKEFLIDDLKHAFIDFVRAMPKQLSIFGVEISINESEIELLLNDMNIEKIKDIEMSHGKYYFQKPEVWKTYHIPCATCNGVYFFFDKHGVALYVGKAEYTNTIGRRVDEHVGRCINGEFPNLEFEKADYVVAIPFNNAPFLSPAFESYLLSEYDFKFNKSGNR